MDLFKVVRFICVVMASLQHLVSGAQTSFSPTTDSVTQCKTPSAGEVVHTPNISGTLATGEAQVFALTSQSPATPLQFRVDCDTGNIIVADSNTLSTTTTTTYTVVVGLTYYPTTGSTSTSSLTVTFTIDNSTCGGSNVYPSLMLLAISLLGVLKLKMD